MRDGLILRSILRCVGKREAAERVEGAGGNLADGICCISRGCGPGNAIGRGGIEAVDDTTQLIFKGGLVIVTQTEIDCNVIRNSPVVLGKECKIVRVEVCSGCVEEASAGWQTKQKTRLWASKRW